ncbi:MAG TPA: peptidylprolyl isomerase [Magnetospirillaceae bacterium]|nr:peptidylprolyl isomerase [Magnetospirillaceae bacterium]
MIVHLLPALRSALRPGTRRGLAFSAVGALVGLGIAGYGLFTAKDTQTALVPPEDIALVNNKPILVADYEAQLQTLFAITPQEATPEQRRKVVHDMIREELFVQRGLEIDEAAVDPDVRAALVNAVDQQAAADALSRTPSVEQLKSFYGQHKEKYATEGVMLLHDLVPVAGAAIPAEAAPALRRGMALADALKRYGLKESGKLNGEEFYFAAKLHIGEALFATAAALDDGAVADPVVVDGTPHLLVMARNRRPSALSFEQTRTEVLGDYQKDQAQRAQAGEESFLAKRAVIRLAPGYEP